MKNGIKAKFIALGILGLIVLVGSIMINVLKETHIHHINNTDYWDSQSDKNAYIGWASVLGISWLVSVIIGIVTLSMNKEPVKGLAIAAGVCAIVVPYANIVLGIVGLVVSNGKSNETVTTQPQPKTNEENTDK